MSSRFISGLTAVLAASLLAACATPTTPALDARFGDAVRAARERQTVDPAAGARADPVSGIDGKAAVHAQDRYHESFKTPPRTFEVLGIGGTLSGQ